MAKKTRNETIVSPETVRESPLGEGLTAAQCRTLARTLTACGLKQGQFLIDEGQKDECLHVITKGSLAVVKPSGSGDWITLSVLHEGDMAGELGFVDGVEHIAGLRALTNTEVFSLNRSDFESLIAKDPELVYKVMRSIIRTVHGILRRMNVQFVEMSNYIYKQHGRY